VDLKCAAAVLTMLKGLAAGVLTRYYDDHGVNDSSRTMGGMFV
jgi:hypothetical protein